MSNSTIDRKNLFNDRDPNKDLTYVQQRSSRLRRLWRQYRILIPIGLILLWLYGMATSTAVLQISLGVMGFVGRIVFVVIFILIQFVAMFWFLGRTRSYDIYPDRTTEGLTYEDYPGQPELLERAKQIVGLLQGVAKFEGMGGEPLTGLLLEGPPGTGKTRLAQVMSTEAGVPFFYVDGSSMVSMFMGMGAFKVMRFYAKARKAAKEYGAAIIFVDEIDSIGASRGGVSAASGAGYRAGDDGVFKIMMGGMGGGGGGLLSALLVEMDGFSHEHGAKAKRREFFWKVRHAHLLFMGRPLPAVPNPHKRVLTVGATNRVAVLDPALMRPGRFDKIIRVDLPSSEGRKAIVKYYLDQMTHDESVDLNKVTQDMIGYTPAAVNHVLNDALRIALYDDREMMSYDDILQAAAEHGVGLRQPVPDRMEEDRVKTAYHEAGHAVLQHALRRDKMRIMRVTIVRYGSAQGHMAPRPIHDRPITSKSKTDLETSICISFAGRAAEEHFLGEITLGAGGDLGHVMSELLQMANSSMLGDYYIGFLQNNDYREAPEIVRKKFDELYQRTLSIIERYADVVEELTGALLEKEEINGSEVEELFGRYEWDPIPQPALAKGKDFGRHYKERVLDAENGFREEIEIGPEPNGQPQEEETKEPGGD